ncbi:MAG: helix-turn-helix domain-containing protein [Bacteroidales bacterium]|nr:helix-turn-helix domain-containing protein [Bacteroidales bacterium]
MAPLTKLILYAGICLSSVHLTAQTVDRHWTVSDGLPTGEVRQMVALPNGQVLVNCEGIFCLSNGKGFDVLPCDRLRCLPLEHYSEDYAHWWQGDSLLWLHDLYHIFLFDARTRSFRYDIEARRDDAQVKHFLLDTSANERLSAPWRTRLDSLGLGTRFTTAIQDWQGGIWLGTTNEGIGYRSPYRPTAQRVQDHGVIDLVRSTTDREGNVWHCQEEGLVCEHGGSSRQYDMRNVDGLPHNRISFIQQLDAGRYLLCASLNLMGYFYPEQSRFVLLNERLPRLNRYRRLVGACPIDDRWVLVYSQNGACMLDCQADSLATFPASADVERYSNKYNCVARHRDGTLWIGTQNGLFRLSPIGTNDYQCSRIGGLANDCIRSLVIDAEGHTWAGTARGIARITPTVINLDSDEGFPTASLMERAAACMADSSLVFAYGPSYAILFRPDGIGTGTTFQRPVVLTGLNINGESLPFDRLSDLLSLPFDRNYLSFRFSALNYATPSHTRYRYRLAGLESEWQSCTDADGRMGTAAYHALAPGNYCFEVQASSDDIHWGESTCMELCILPPRWLSWWAKSLYALAMVASVMSVLHLYLRSKRRKMERENDLRVNRLFELREEARHQFAESTHIDPRKIGTNSEEKELSAKMLAAIEAHLSDADYGVDQLAQDVCMSRSALYSKLRDMLGISPADFIRNVRLKRAAQLLSDTDMPIGEIADLMGYNTHKAFAANFKRMFGMLPSEYRAPKKLVDNPLSH